MTLTLDHLRVEPHILVSCVDGGFDFALVREADVDAFLADGLECHVTSIPSAPKQELTVLVTGALGIEMGS